MKNSNDELYVEDYLEESLFKEAEEIDKMAIGSEERRIAVDDFNQRWKAWLEWRKTFDTIGLESRKRDDDVKFKRIEIIVGFVSTLLSVGIPLIFYNKWMKQGLDFEKTGTFTSSTFKNFLRCIKPTKFW